MSKLIAGDRDNHVAQFRAHLASRGVSREWWPERVAVLESFPTSSGGKIAKAELRDRVAELFPEGSQ